jgi:formylglycine-generating enzyme required for sulfatase activity
MQGSPDTDPDAYLDEKPERAVVVSPFLLDKFEVTVGRFRRFVERGDSTPPPPGAGAHPKIAGSGWRGAWNARLPKSRDEWEFRLLSCIQGETWSPTSGPADALPINCVDWYAAFAFCAWDGGRLPTEAEWEYAAAGGDENRRYPWGASAPDPNLAVFCGPAIYPCWLDHIALVGSKPSGAGRWGHLDLAGNMGELVLDAYDLYPSADAEDFANTTEAAHRVTRGGGWWTLGAKFLRASARTYGSVSGGGHDGGFRCARNQ